MTSALGTALSSLRAFTVALNVGANNLANVNTEGFKSKRVIMQETRPAGVRAVIEGSCSSCPLNREEFSKVDMADELAGLIVARQTFKANIILARTAGEAEKSLMHIIA